MVPSPGLEINVHVWLLSPVDPFTGWRSYSKEENSVGREYDAWTRVCEHAGGGGRGGRPSEEPN